MSVTYSSCSLTHCRLLMPRRLEAKWSKLKLILTPSFDGRVRVDIDRRARYV